MISVVIPVHDGGPAFAACLDAVLASEHPDFEVIVVDDASTDDSAAVAQTRGVVLISHDRQRGPAAARNTGAARARGELLVLLDADVVVPPDALATAEAFLREHPRLTGLSAVYTARSRVRGFGSRYLNLKQRYFQLQLPPEPDTAWTAFFAVRRDAFDGCGGLDATMHHPAADDLVLGSRLAAAGGRLAFRQDIEVEHLKEVSVLGVLRFHHVHAREWSRASRRYRLLLPQKASHSRRPVGNTLLGAGLGGLLLCGPAALLLPLPFGVAVGGIGVVAVAWNADFLRWLAKHQGRRFAALSLPVILGEGLANATGLASALLRRGPPVADSTGVR